MKLFVSPQRSMKSRGIQEEFRPLDFFALRTPIFPFEEFSNWTGQLSVSTNAYTNFDGLEACLDADRKRLTNGLLHLIRRPEIREALFLSSPDLIDALDVWGQEPESKRGKRIGSAVLRYFLRMTSRPTPFGLMAGCSFGSITDRTHLELSSFSHYRRHTRLDMDYLFELSDQLNQNAEIRTANLYRPNSTLYRNSGFLRYVECRTKDRERSYHLVTVEETEEITGTIARAREGASIRTLASALVSPDISEQEAEEFIHDLIDAQVLISDICFSVSGPEPVHTLISRLNQSAKTEPVAKILSNARDKLAAMDRDGTGIEISRYRDLADELKELPAKVDLSRLFQLDLTKPSPHATLSADIAYEILRGAEILISMSDAEDHRELRNFRNLFIERYEMREVPFLEALDEEIGIGFGESEESSSLLRDLDAAGTPEDRKWSNQEAYLLRKVNETIERGLTGFELTEKDLKALESRDRLPLADTFAAMAILAAESKTDLEQGRFRLMMENVHGSGARLLGRFCHSDDHLRQRVSAYLREEELRNPDVIFAEIVHLPEGRLGNILARPQMREYEIPYLGHSAVSPEFQIPAGDLKISVRNSRIVLRSERLGKELIPRMTNAHNFNRLTLGAYRFLCQLQFQDSHEWIGWNWGLLKNAPFLPRVTSGRLLLCIARWRLDSEELNSFNRKQGKDLFQEIQQLRNRRKLPRFVTLRDYDHALLIDFDNILCIEMFAQVVKGRNEAILTEIFPEPDELLVFGPEGSFVHELIVPFIRKSEFPAPSPQPSHVLQAYAVERSFAPGSDWLYAKFYSGAVTLDHLLQESFRIWINELKETGEVDSWFFLRYGDPDWHIRLRLHGNAAQLQARVLPELTTFFAQLLKDGKIHRAQLDTYMREVERYGGPEGILLAEKIFHVDSEAVLQLLELLEPGDEGLEERWRLTLRGMDLLLNGFGFEIHSKLKIISKARESFGKEFHISKPFTQELSQKFRKLKKDLTALLEPDYKEDHPLAAGFEVLENRSKKLLPILNEYKSLDLEQKLCISLDEIALSLIHMQANRMLRSAHRKQELIIYDFLKCLYQGQLSRNLNR